MYRFRTSIQSGSADPKQWRDGLFGTDLNLSKWAKKYYALDWKLDIGAKAKICHGSSAKAWMWSHDKTSSCADSLSKAVQAWSRCLRIGSRRHNWLHHLEKGFNMLAIRLEQCLKMSFTGLWNQWQNGYKARPRWYRRIYWSFRSSPCTNGSLGSQGWADFHDSQAFEKALEAVEASMVTNGYLTWHDSMSFCSSGQFSRLWEASFGCQRIGKVGQPQWGRLETVGTVLWKEYINRPCQDRRSGSSIPFATPSSTKGHDWDSNSKALQKDFIRTSKWRYPRMHPIFHRQGLGQLCSVDRRRSDQRHRFGGRV